MLGPPGDHHRVPAVLVGLSSDPQTLPASQTAERVISWTMMLMTSTGGMVAGTGHAVPIAARQSHTPPPQRMFDILAELSNRPSQKVAP